MCSPDLNRTFLGERAKKKNPKMGILGSGGERLGGPHPRRGIFGVKKGDFGAVSEDDGFGFPAGLLQLVQVLPHRVQ